MADAPSITREEAMERVLFLSSGLAMTTPEIEARWPRWKGRFDEIDRTHGRDSAQALIARCEWARPAYAALGFRTARGI